MHNLFSYRFNENKRKNLSLVFNVIFLEKQNCSCSYKHFSLANKKRNHVKLDKQNVPNHSICLIVE